MITSCRREWGGIEAMEGVPGRWQCTVPCTVVHWAVVVRYQSAIIIDPCCTVEPVLCRHCSRHLTLCWLTTNPRRFFSLTPHFGPLVIEILFLYTSSLPSVLLAYTLTPKFTLLMHVFATRISICDGEVRKVSAVRLILACWPWATQPRVMWGTMSITFGASAVHECNTI